MNSVSEMAAIKDSRFEDADEDMPISAELKPPSDWKRQSEQKVNAEERPVTWNEVWK